MNIKRITAIVPIEALLQLEKHLRDCGVPGVTVETVRGYGEHPNYFRQDLMQDNAKLVRADVSKASFPSIASTGWSTWEMERRHHPGSCTSELPGVADVQRTQGERIRAVHRRSIQVPSLVGKSANFGMQREP
jgi:hypothetical protein